MATGNAQENKGADVPATEDGLKRIQDALQKQMEYYFSSENLARDKYLQSLMDASSSVAVKELCRFRKMTAIAGEAHLELLPDLIPSAARASPFLEITPQGRIKPLNAAPSRVVRPERTTIILRDLPSDTQPDKILQAFSGGGKAPVKKLRPDVGATWFVSFASEAEAVATMLRIQKKEITHPDGSSLKARLKSETQPTFTQQPWPPQSRGASPHSQAPHLAQRRYATTPAAVHGGPGAWIPPGHMVLATPMAPMAVYPYPVPGNKNSPVGREGKEGKAHNSQQQQQGQQQQGPKKKKGKAKKEQLEEGPDLGASNFPPLAPGAKNATKPAAWVAHKSSESPKSRDAAAKSRDAAAKSPKPGGSDVERLGGDAVAGKNKAPQARAASSAESEGGQSSSLVSETASSPPLSSDSSSSGGNSSCEESVPETKAETEESAAKAGGSAEKKVTADSAPAAWASKLSFVDVIKKTSK